MISIQQLLDAAKAGANIPSNYRLARVLGVHDNTLNRWQHARGLPDDVMAVRLAEMAHLDPDYVVASMHAARAATDDERSLWTRIARRLEAVAAAVLVGTVLSAPTPAPAQGTTAEPLCVMSNRRRRKKRPAAKPAALGSHLAALFHPPLNHI